MKPGPAPLALASLPAVQGELVGRDLELERLLALLGPATESAAGTVVMSAVAGLAGVGKTTLAVHAAHRAVERGWFPGGHLFLDLRGYEPTGQVTAGQALGALLRAVCGADAPLPTDPVEQAGLYRSRMAALGREQGPVLLVLDSVGSTAQVQNLLPGGSGHRVLITSRHTLASLPAKLVELAVLKPSDAAAVITQFLGPGDPRPGLAPQFLAELADRCGHLPLALQITAANLKADPQRSLASLAGELEDERARLALSYSDGEQSLAVRASFELSYRRLPPEQARLFRLLSFNPTPQFSLDAVSALTGQPPHQARQIAVGLGQAHLIEPVTEQRWRMHDLLRLYSAQLAGTADPDGHGDQDEAFGRLLAYYRDTADAADDHVIARPGQPVPDRFGNRAEAAAWLDTERANLITLVSLTATPHPRTAIALAECLLSDLDTRRQFDDAIAITRHALNAARLLHHRDTEGEMLNFLGSGLRQVRRFEEAIDAHTQAADISRETGDRDGEGMALMLLCVALHGVRRFEEAITASTQAASIFRETGNRHGEEAALDSQGLALQGVRRFGEAIDAHTQAADISRETGDRHSEGEALLNLGTALMEVRRFEEAITASTQAADTLRETGDQHNEGMALANVGTALLRAGRFEEAITASTQAADTLRETGDQHSEGEALLNLSAALMEVRRFEEAITASTQAADTFRETGDQHREGLALNNVGATLREAGEFEEAITVSTQAADTLRETGDRHGEAQALNTVGAALQRAGRFEEAITVSTQAADTLCETGDRHGEAQALNNLGLALREAGRGEEAIDAHTQAAAIFRETGDRRSEGTALTGLGNALMKVRRLTTAADAYGQAIALYRATGDSHGEDIATNNLFVALRKVRRFSHLRYVLRVLWRVIYQGV
ncbi:tetratricopeptide repeat protein [Streptomyces tubercidicus]|uniref:tetratricopeptide repeat protein n=1 Tax=Streptomyces tubercidicus TaxID=47759 RepID=UPI0037A4A67A